MPSQADFANQTPEVGEIRILYRRINGKDTIRAITVSNEDLQNTSIEDSLRELSNINLQVTGSLERTILSVVNTGTKKSGYFFFDTSNNQVINISGSEQSNVYISPYLTEKFINSDYNIILNNALVNRASTIGKYTLDKQTGFLEPTNLSAVVGIEVQGITDLLFTNNKTTQSVSNIASGSLNLTGSSNVAGITTTNHTRIYVKSRDLYATLGIPELKLARIVDSNNANISGDIRTTLYLQVSPNASFTTAVTSSKLGYQQYYNNRNYYTVLHGGYVKVKPSTETTYYFRLKQETTVSEVSNASNSLILTSIISGDTAGTKYIPVYMSPNVKTPYAEVADVQDFNYILKGSVRGKYEGSKTTEDDYSGISPVITGTPFKAATYLSNSVNNFICSQSLSDRDIVDLLFQGTGEMPQVGDRVLQISGSRIIPVSSKKVWVKDNQQILVINSTGYVTGSITSCTI